MTVVCACRELGTSPFRKSSSTAPLTPEKGRASSSSSTVGLRSEEPQVRGGRFWCEPLVPGPDEDDADWLADDRFGRMASQNGRKVGRHAASCKPVPQGCRYSRSN